MKRKAITALHDMSAADLQKKLAELTMEFAKARLEKKVGRLTNPRIVSSLADDIARVKTVMKAKIV
jgi:ribosomal protein L29